MPTMPTRGRRDAGSPPSTASTRSCATSLPTPPPSPTTARPSGWARATWASSAANCRATRSSCAASMPFPGPAVAPTTPSMTSTKTPRASTSPPATASSSSPPTTRCRRSTPPGRYSRARAPSAPWSSATSALCTMETSSAPVPRAYCPSIRGGASPTCCCGPTAPPSRSAATRSSPSAATVSRPCCPTGDWWASRASPIRPTPASTSPPRG